MILLSTLALADDVISAPPIVKYSSTAADELALDPVLPTQSAIGNNGTAQGSIQNPIFESLAYPISGTGSPGSVSSFRGLGRSSEDIDVQSLGIPLNGSQGGGFDLSSFPSFIWSDFHFQLGPSLNAFDPRGVSGALVLVPWTARALDEETSGYRATYLYSDVRLNQFSLGFRKPKEIAVLAGFSTGDSQGPAASLSGAWGHEAVHGSYHLLFTGLDAKSPGSASFPTPQEHLLTQRLIPVGEMEVKLPANGLLKTTVFYDAQIIRDQDPTLSLDDRSYSQQAGLENALLLGDWKIGVSGREIVYRALSVNSQNEQTLNLQLSKEFEWKNWLVEPTIQAIGVSRFGVFPGGSLGIKQTLMPSQLSAFARATYSRRFPSLVDRFYNQSFFRGNADLIPEEDLTFNFGLDWEASNFSVILQFFTQNRSHAQINVTQNGVGTLLNLGSAEITSELLTTVWKVSSWLSLSSDFTWSQSNLDATQQPFPYLPSVLEIVGAHFYFPKKSYEINALSRFSAPVSYDLSGNLLPAYQNLDLSFIQPVGTHFRFQYRIENVFDQHYQLIQDFPVRGRAFSLLLSGEF